MDYLAQNRNPFSASPLNLQKTKEIKGKEAHLSSSRVCTQQWRPPPPGKLAGKAKSTVRSENRWKRKGTQWGLDSGWNNNFRSEENSQSLPILHPQPPPLTGKMKETTVRRWNSPMMKKNSEAASSQRDFADLGGRGRKSKWGWEGGRAVREVTEAEEEDESEEENRGGDGFCKEMKRKACLARWNKGGVR